MQKVSNMPQHEWKLFDAPRNNSNLIRHIKHLFLYLFKIIGLFSLCELLTKNGLRILCYHNFSNSVEVEWRPGLFIRPLTLLRRMETLQARGFRVLPLDTAVSLLKKNRLPSKSVVITIDDGWYGTKEYADAILSAMSYPYTIYLASYYSLKQTPVFHLLINYMIWEAERRHIHLLKLKHDLADVIDLSKSNSLTQVERKLVNCCLSFQQSGKRTSLMEKLASCIGLDYGSVVQSRIFNYLNSNEIVALSRNGVDIQLHSHTHNLPLSREEAAREIADNRAYIEPIIGKRTHHFCYPSGIWHPNQFPILTSLGISSATTCDVGLSYFSTNVLALHRFLDSEAISQIQFESYICGVNEFVLLAKKLLSRVSAAWKK